MSISFTTIVALAGMYGTYVNAGSDSLRTDIYQPLYREVGVMGTAIHSNNVDTNYSTDIYQKLTRDGSLGRIPHSLCKEIVRLYNVEGEARGHIIPIAHKISVLMPREIVKIRTEGNDNAWTEKAVAQLNLEAAPGLTQGSFPMAMFTLNHTAISPAIDVRDPAHPKIASPGTVTWLVSDWLGFPRTASEVSVIWRSTYYLGFDEKVEGWNYRITQDDLTRNHITLESFLRPTYQVIATDPEFQALVRNNQTALDLLGKVEPSLADRVKQPKHLMDLIGFF